MQAEQEMNPALGQRGIRLYLKYPELLTTQLRAIYRASIYGNAAIMFPMIVSVEEVIELKKTAKQVKEQLARESARQGLYLPVQGIRSTEDKTMRVESLQPDVKNGYILFRADQTLLLQQLSKFPLGAHDDGPDALEGARTLSRKNSRGAKLTGLRV